MTIQGPLISTSFILLIRRYTSSLTCHSLKTLAKSLMWVLSSIVIGRRAITITRGAITTSLLYRPGTQLNTTCCFLVVSTVFIRLTKMVVCKQILYLIIATILIG